MIYVCYDSVTGKITTAYGDLYPTVVPPYIAITETEWTQAMDKGYNTVNLETLTLCYVDYRTPEEIEADRIKALIPSWDLQQKTLRELETLNLLVELGRESITDIPTWSNRYAILMASSLITIDKVPELLRTTVQEIYDHWFD